MARKVKRKSRPTAQPRSQQAEEDVVQDQVSRIQSLPLDVLFEILSRFDLPSLFHFAFVSKDFRRLVLSKRNATLWTTGWRNTQPALPPCPESISILKVAAFLFLPACHHCELWDNHFMFWDLRARYCRRCARTIEEHHVTSGIKLGAYIADMPPRDKTVAEMIGPVRPKLARDIAERKFSEFFRVWSAPTHETLSIVEEHWTKGVLWNEITKLRASLFDLTDEARTNYLLQRAATLEQWRTLIPSLQELHKQWTESRLEGEEGVASASRPT